MKNQNWVHLYINSQKCYKVCFYCMSSGGLPKHIKIKVLTTCFYLISLKGKNISGTSLPVLFSTWVLKKKISCYILLTDQIFLPDICIVIMCYPVCDIINFGINLNLLIKLFFFFITKESRQKCKYLKNEKSF